MQAQNQHLDHLIGPSFQAVNRIFVLSFEDNSHRTSYNQYFLPIVEIKDYHIMTDSKNFLVSKKGYEKI